MGGLVLVLVIGWDDGDSGILGSSEGKRMRKTFRLGLDYNSLNFTYHLQWCNFGGKA
jgi:hypothetical protein